MKKEVCVVFDIGKTNKKVVVFDKNFEIVYENQVVFEEILDDEAEPCDDLMALTVWMKNQFDELSSNPNLDVKGLNFSAYGASLVYINQYGKPIAPLYNYLKKLPKNTKQDFSVKYNQDGEFYIKTASPDLGLLNSGLQLFWIKKNKTDIFKNSKHILHFPQYLSYVFTQKPVAEPTSLGCHTAMWDYEKNTYHNWLKNEHLEAAMPEVIKTESTYRVENIEVGVGIHDSSAALVPYLKTIADSFVLISTGTWCISLNPFNERPLTADLLGQDCLNFLSFEGKQVRASRLFAGNEHARQVKHLSEYFGVELEYYKSVNLNYKTIQELRKKQAQVTPQQTQLGRLQECPFVERNLNAFKTYEEAYHQFIMDLVAQQVASTQLVFGTQPPKKIFVDGGFSKNEIYMNLLSEAFHNIQVYSSDLAQASAIGAALLISNKIGFSEFDSKMLKLTRY